jgi:hypothetical protein
MRWHFMSKLRPLGDIGASLTRIGAWAPTPAPMRDGTPFLLKSHARLNDILPSSLHFPNALSTLRLQSPMKRVLASLLLLTAWSRADIVIEQKMESAFVNGNMVMKIKGDQARMDMPAGGAGNITVLMNTTTGEMATLMHQQKMAMKMNLAAAKKQAEQQAKATGIDPSKMEKPKSTGKTEKVGEWDAEIFEGNVGGSTAKFWVAKDFPNHKAIMDQMNKLSAATGSAGFDPSKFDLGGMVVKSEMNTPAGKVTTTLVRAKEENVDAADFAMPTGYQEMKVPGQ